ncbi:MAG TPA: serine hydrolase [Anaerolineales bacterium]|nr:serine hydrolase [Anaerolineales bacterium]
MFDLTPVLEPAGDKLIGIALHDFETGAEYFRNADEAFHPASTFKVHVMMEVFRQANEGWFSLADTLPILNTFTSIADGSPYSLDVNDDAEQSLYPRLGETESILELTRLMIVRSSNLATNILLEKIGVDRVDQFVRSLGIEGVRIIRGIEDKVAFHRGLNNSASARGLTQTMILIAEEKIVSQQASQKMIGILLGQEFNESIPARLPGSVQVAHKTGWTDDFYHDTGIVYPNGYTPEGRKPYVISIMTKRFPEDRAGDAHKCMAAISRLLYEQLARRR